MITSLYTQKPLPEKIIIGIVGLGAITAIAIALIGLISPHAYSFAQPGITENAIILGLAAPVLILDIFWANRKLSLPKNLTFFDENDWKKLGPDLRLYDLDLSDTNPLTEKDLNKVIQLAHSLPVEGDAGITLLTIPKGLNLRKILEMGESSKTSIKPKHPDQDALKQFEDITVSATYRVAITNGILKNTKGLSSEAQMNILRTFEGCEAPEILPLVTLIIITYINSKKLMLETPAEKPPNHQPTYTRCQEKIEGVTIVVGECCQERRKQASFPLFKENQDPECYPFYGMGIMHKFLPEV